MASTPLVYQSNYPPYPKTYQASAKQVSTSFWLPRMLDEAVSDPLINLVKCLNLPLLAGLPSGLRWSRLPPLDRAFIWANFIPKITLVGALYLISRRTPG